MGRFGGVACCLLLSCAVNVAGLKDAHPRGEWAAVMAEHRRAPEETLADIIFESVEANTLDEDARIPVLAARPGTRPEAALEVAARTPEVLGPSGDHHSVSAMQRRRQQTQGPYTTLLILLLVFLPLFVAFVMVIMFVAGPKAKNGSQAPAGAAGVALISQTASMSQAVSPSQSRQMSRAGSFVAREGTGVSVSMLGIVRPQPQDAVLNVVEVGQGSSDLFAQVCISEDRQGTGILIHGSGSAPVAMLDTTFAFGAAGGPPPANRMVRIHQIDAASQDYVRQPYAEVRPGRGGCVMYRGSGGSEEMMSIRVDQSGQLSQVVTKGGILAQLEVSPNGTVAHMSAGTFDRHMVLCAVVAAMKLG